MGSMTELVVSCGSWCVCVWQDGGKVMAGKVHAMYVETAEEVGAAIKEMGEFSLEVRV
jgi:hypothetical protein